MRIVGAVVMLIGIAGFAFAGTNQAPEIDANTGIAALALLSGGLLVLRARRKK